MYIKPYSLGILLAIGFLLSAASTAQPPSQQLTRKKPIHWNNTPLKEILAELVTDFKVTICNPQHIEGIPLTATGSNGESITALCAIVTREEKGHAYLQYQKGVVYVSGRPFPQAFAPNKQEWPCR